MYTPKDKNFPNEKSTIWNEFENDKKDTNKEIEITKEKINSEKLKNIEYPKKKEAKKKNEKNINNDYLIDTKKINEVNIKKAIQPYSLPYSALKKLARTPEKPLNIFPGSIIKDVNKAY